MQMNGSTGLDWPGSGLLAPGWPFFCGVVFPCYEVTVYFSRSGGFSTVELSQSSVLL
jgi:hypothetical protein